MSTANINDPNVFTAMMLSDGIVKGFEQAQKALPHVIYSDENSFTSLIASLAALKVLEHTLIKSASQISKEPMSFFMPMLDKVTTGVLLHNVTAGSMSMSDVESLVDDEIKFKALLPIFQRAENNSKKDDGANLSDAVEELSSYMKMK